MHCGRCCRANQPEPEYRPLAFGAHSPEKVTREPRRRLTQMGDGAQAEAVPGWVTNHLANQGQQQ